MVQLGTWTLVSTHTHPTEIPEDKVRIVKGRGFVSGFYFFYLLSNYLCIVRDVGSQNHRHFAQKLAFMM